MNAICENCGLSKGAHRGDSKVPDQCPAHEGGMDWPVSGVTTFRDSGNVEDIELGTPSALIDRVEV